MAIPSNWTIRRAAAIAAVVAAALALMLLAVPKAEGSHVQINVQRDIPYGPSAWHRLDIHRPQGGPAARPAVMVIHGGGWISRDKQNVAPIAQRLAHAGFVAVNVNFTNAAAGRPGFPRQRNELRSALRFIRANAAGFGVDPARIGAYGSSTGAHLAALVATTGQGPLTQGGRVRAAVSWGGIYRLRNFRGAARFKRRIATFLGCRGCPKRAGNASPLRHVSKDDPPIMIVHSRRETIHLSQATRMARALRRKGVFRRLRVLPGKAHLPIGKPQVLGETITFLKRRLG